MDRLTSLSNPSSRGNNRFPSRAASHNQTFLAGNYDDPSIEIAELRAELEMAREIIGMLRTSEAQALAHNEELRKDYEQLSELLNSAQQDNNFLCNLIKERGLTNA